MPSAIARQPTGDRADVQAIPEELGKALAPLAGSHTPSYRRQRIPLQLRARNHRVAERNRLGRSPCRVISLDNLRTGAAGRVAHLAGRSRFPLRQPRCFQPLQPG